MVRARRALPIALLAVAGIACAGEKQDTPGGGSGGSAGGLITGGSGGFGGGGGTCAEPAGEGGTLGDCQAAVRVGTGENTFKGVAPCAPVDVHVPSPDNPQPQSGHVWTALLLRGFTPGEYLTVTFEVFLEDGTLYRRSRSCLPTLSSFSQQAGWYVVYGLRALMKDKLDGGDPQADLFGMKTITVRATVDNGGNRECRDLPEPTCRVTSAMRIAPVIVQDR